MTRSPQLFADIVCPFTNMCLGARKKSLFFGGWLALRWELGSLAKLRSSMLRLTGKFCSFLVLQLSSNDTSRAEDCDSCHHHRLCPGAVLACPASGIHCKAWFPLETPGEWGFAVLEECTVIGVKTHYRVEEYYKVPLNLIWIWHITEHTSNALLCILSAPQPGYLL